MSERTTPPVLPSTGGTRAAARRTGTMRSCGAEAAA